MSYSGGGDTAGGRTEARYADSVPETLAERLVFVAGLLLIGLLIAAIVYRPKTSDGAAAQPPRTTTARTTTAPAPLVTTTSTPTTTAARPTTTTETVGTTTTTAAPAGVELRVSARDDTWLSIRRGSATGAVLFEGTLTKGDSRTYTATAFHVRFGAAANVKATLDGKPLALPGGTYSATIDRAGLGTRSA